MEAAPSEACWSCGYDLAGSGGVVCPECGSPVRDLRGALDPGAVERRRRRWCTVSVLLVGLTWAVLWVLWRAMG